MNLKYKIGLGVLALVISFFAGKASNNAPDKITSEAHVSSSDFTKSVNLEAEKLAKQMLKEWQKNLKRTINRTISASGDVTESIVEESSESSKELESVLFEKNRMELAESIKKYELLQKTVAENHTFRLFGGIGVTSGLRGRYLVGASGEAHGAVLTSDGSAEHAGYYTFGKNFK